jgi:hypothetical protein
MSISNYILQVELFEFKTGLSQLDCVTQLQNLNLPLATNWSVFRKYPPPLSRTVSVKPLNEDASTFKIVSYRGEKWGQSIVVQVEGQIQHNPLKGEGIITGKIYLGSLVIPMLIFVAVYGIAVTVDFLRKSIWIAIIYLIFICGVEYYLWSSAFTDKRNLKALLVATLSQ